MGMQLFTPPAVMSTTAVSALAVPITTASIIDVVATDMTITPEAGTYFVMFSADMQTSTNNTGLIISLYMGGVQIANTERTLAQAIGGVIAATFTFRMGMTLQSTATVDGTQAIDVRWRATGGGTATMGGARSLTVVLIVVA